MINQLKVKYLQYFNQNAFVKFKHQTKFSKIPIVRERDCRWIECVPCVVLLA